MNTVMQALVSNMEANLAKKNLQPGTYIKVGKGFFIINDNGTASPADLPEDIEFVDLDAEILQPAVAKKPQRFRRFPGDKKVKAYVNNKPCKRKQKK